MISLNLEPYCQKGCRMFDPKVTKRGYLCQDVEVVVECEWRSQCHYLHNYLKVKGDINDKDREG